jgi:hypothetical protein
MSHQVTVYDAHPGLAGCERTIPEALRIVAKSIEGQRMMIQEVIDLFRSTVSEGAFELKEDFISYGAGRQIYIPCASPGLLVWENNWRVVRIER